MNSWENKPRVSVVDNVRDLVDSAKKLHTIVFTDTKLEGGIRGAERAAIEYQKIYDETKAKCQEAEETITSKNKSIQEKVRLLKLKKEQLEEERDSLLKDSNITIADIKEELKREHCEKKQSREDMMLPALPYKNREDMMLPALPDNSREDMPHPSISVELKYSTAFSTIVRTYNFLNTSLGKTFIDWLYNRKMNNIKVEELKAYEKYKSIHEKNIADLKKATEDELKKFSEGEQEFNEIIKELANAVADLSIEIAKIKTRLTELNYLMGKFNER